MNDPTRSKEHQPDRTRYHLTGTAGTLIYDPGTPNLSADDSGLSADGDLPMWIVANGYAQGCRRSLYLDGEEGLWRYLESLYRDAQSASTSAAT